MSFSIPAYTPIRSSTLLWFTLSIITYVLVSLIHNVQIAIDCNENIRRAENEFKLFAITKRFPNDDVDIVSVKTIRPKGKWFCVGSFRLGMWKVYVVREKLMISISELALMQFIVYSLLMKYSDSKISIFIPSPEKMARTENGTLRRKKR